MSEGVVVIGDRLTTLPFRLAGFSVSTPADGQVTSIFDAAMASGVDLVLLTPAATAALRAGRLARARLAARPLVLVLPLPGAAAFDVRRDARRAIGLET